MRHIAIALSLALGACAHQSAQNPEDEPTPQIRVVPGAASRSLWIGHGGDAGVPGPGRSGPGSGSGDADAGPGAIP